MNSLFRRLLRRARWKANPDHRRILDLAQREGKDVVIFLHSKSTPSCEAPVVYRLIGNGRWIAERIPSRHRPTTVIRNSMTYAGLVDVGSRCLDLHYLVVGSYIERGQLEKNLQDFYIPSFSTGTIEYLVV